MCIMFDYMCFDVVYIISRCTLIFSFVGPHVCVVFYRGQGVLSLSSQAFINSFILPMNIASAMQQILGVNPAGCIFFPIGPEGSGKSSMSKAIQESVPEVQTIGISVILREYIEEQSSSKIPIYSPETLACVRRKMNLRQKDIRLCFVRDALLFALKKHTGVKVLIIEGWLRQPEQCKNTIQFLSDYFPHHLLICAEAVCSLQTAFERAVKNRALATDKPDIIQRCHQEYEQLSPVIMGLCDQFAHTLQISTENSPEETLQHLGASLHALAMSLKKGDIKTPARLLGWVEEESQAAA